MAPRGDHHSLAEEVIQMPHFGLGQRYLIDQRSSANPGSIPPLGTIYSPNPVTIQYSYLSTLICCALCAVHGH